VLSHLFAHEMDKHDLPSNPAIVLKRVRTRAEKMQSDPERRERRYLTDEELARLGAELPDRYAMLVRLGRVGLRPGEALALRVGRFDPKRRTLTIDTSLTGSRRRGKRES
jgi:integrase